MVGMVMTKEKVELFVKVSVLLTTFESEITFFYLEWSAWCDKGEGRVICKGVSTVDYCIYVHHHF